ncbi:MAG: 4-hydroxyphenylpyruvate dioxygenase [Legionellales bacterium]
MELHNPCKLDGFAFLEFSAPDPSLLHQQFPKMGFQKIAQHKNQDISLYKQGSIHFIVNAAENTQAAVHAKTHGSGACAMGFKVADAEAAFQYAIAQGATAFDDCSHAHHSLPAIQAIGGSVIYFVDGTHEPFAKDWNTTSIADVPGTGLIEIDHLTHNVFRGNMDKWAAFYTNLFNFQEIRYFNIKGKMTGLVSRALGSPCGKIKIPLNESKDDLSQIEEFLQDYNGEGIQHIALTTGDIYTTIHSLRAHQVQFLDVPDTYYDRIDKRLPWHTEPLKKLQSERILIDGEPTPEHGLLLQIFTENVFGPMFFEIIQRKGNQGFGEGNFQALFEAIERDQIKRGTLKEAN